MTLKSYKIKGLSKNYDTHVDWLKCLISLLSQCFVFYVVILINTTFFSMTSFVDDPLVQMNLGFFNTRNNFWATLVFLEVGLCLKSKHHSQVLISDTHGKCSKNITPMVVVYLTNEMTRERRRWEECPFSLPTFS